MALPARENRPERRPGAGFTEPQKKALCYLATVPYATPAQLGHAIGGTRRGYAQGLGRIGGAMGSRLKKLGFVRGAEADRSGYPAYALNMAGRQAVKEMQRASADRLVQLVRIGCTAADVHLKCSHPDCTCTTVPDAIKAVVKAIEGTK